MAQLNSLRTENKFKKTEIGEIPVDWEVKTIINAVGGENGLIVAGPFGSNLNVKDYRDKGVPIIRLQNIECCKFVNKDIKYTSPGKAEELRYHSFRKGDVVLAKLGDPIGKTCIVPKFLDGGIVVADIVRIRIDEQYADSKFIMYILNSFYVLDQLNREIIGTTRPSINLGQIRNLLIPFPPTIEQKRIAEILSTVDEAIERSRTIIEKTKELKKGLMQELLTRGIGHKKFKKAEIGMIPVDWKVVKLKELYKSPIRDFGSFSTTKLVKYTSKGVPFLRSENFKEGRLVHENIMYISEEVHRKLRKSFIKKGILMFAKIGNLGHSDIYDGQYGECNSNATIAKIDIDEEKAFVPYVRWILNSKIAMKQFQGRIINTPPRINLGEISKLSIPLPIYSEQEKIAKTLNNLESLIDNEEKRKKNVETLKNGLMQSLLTGRTRVKT